MIIFHSKNLNHISLFNSDFIEKYKDDFYKNKHQNAALIWNYYNLIFGLKSGCKKSKIVYDFKK